MQMQTMLPVHEPSDQDHNITTRASPSTPSFLADTLGKTATHAETTNAAPFLGHLPPPAYAVNTRRAALDQALQHLIQAATFAVVPAPMSPAANVPNTTPGMPGTPTASNPHRQHGRIRNCPEWLQITLFLFPVIVITTYMVLALFRRGSGPFDDICSQESFFAAILKGIPVDVSNVYLGIGVGLLCVVWHLFRKMVDTVAPAIDWREGWLHVFEINVTIVLFFLFTRYVAVVEATLDCEV